MDYDFRNITTGKGDFKVVDTNGDGNEEISYKFCKSHWCSDYSGAIIYDPARNQLSRLAYRKGEGITLSADLAFDENRRTREWLLNWWKEWPGPSSLQERVGIQYEGEASADRK